MSARSDSLKRRSALLRRIYASVSNITKAFDTLTLAEMHSRYDAVRVELEESCRDDPICALELKRYVSESVFRAYFLKETGGAETMRALKHLISGGYSEDISVCQFALMVQVTYEWKRHVPYLKLVFAKYGARVEHHLQTLGRDYRLLKRQQNRIRY